MEDAVVDAQEDARAGELALERRVRAGSCRSSGASSSRWRDAEVVVEVACRSSSTRGSSSRSAPCRPRASRSARARPTPSRCRGSRRARIRPSDISSVPAVQLGQPFSHSGVEHEVHEDQLQPPVEEVEQRLLAVRAGEHVGLVDLDHRQPAALGAERVAATRQLLLLLPEAPCERSATRHAKPPWEGSCWFRPGGRCVDYRST